MDSVFESIFAGIDAFVYRCSNDKDYSMHFMSSGVNRMLGYRPEDIIHSASVSYVGLIVGEDQDHVFDEVDAAIAAGKPLSLIHI